LVALAIAIASIIVTALVLLHEADAATGNARASLRVDALKTALTVGAGTGGLGALLLAARRQWLSERSQIYSERDMVERRVTDLYGVAATGLGSSSPAERLASVYALERIAQSYTDQRQQTVNLMCGYLRTSRDENDHHVRAALLQVLQSHVAMASEYPERRWEDLDLRLEVTRLFSINLSGNLGEVVFEGSEVQADALFWSASFAKSTNFRSAHFFRYVDFSRADFQGDADFSDVFVHGFGNFSKATFRSRATFFGATIEVEADFSEVNFKGYADFAALIGSGSLNFSHARFESGARFDPSQVASFEDAVLVGEADEYQLPAGFQLEAVSERVWAVRSVA
jgi:hypothetical protein